MVVGGGEWSRDMGMKLQQCFEAQRVENEECVDMRGWMVDR